MSEPTALETADDEQMVDAPSITHPRLPRRTFASRDDCREALDEAARLGALAAALATQTAYTSPSGALAAARRLDGALAELVDAGAIVWGSRGAALSYAAEAASRALPPTTSPGKGESTTTED